MGFTPWDWVKATIGAVVLIAVAYVGYIVAWGIWG